jgi:hypothetical protein
MSDEADIVVPRRTRRGRVFAVLAIVAIAVGGFAWQQFSWLDPRFVGVWRVTHNKSDDFDEIYILNSDGSGSRLVQTSNGAWQRLSPGFRYGWRINRAGFGFGTNPTFAVQLWEYVEDLGGLRSRGKLRMFHYYGGLPGELANVTPDRIVLRFRQAGIIKPDELTLTRMKREDLPTWK